MDEGRGSSRATKGGARPRPRRNRDMKGFNRFKTWVLIAALGGLFIGIGSIWGRNGMIIALVIALVFNFAMYWFSDKIAVATSRAKPVTEEQYPELYRT